MGSFCPVAGKRHLHRCYSFAELLQETAVKSLHHSCRSELHVCPRFLAAQTIRSPDWSELRISLPEYFRLPDGFISIAVFTISSKPSRFRCPPSCTKQQIRSNRTTSACLDER